MHYREVQNADFVPAGLSGAPDAAPALVSLLSAGSDPFFEQLAGFLESETGPLRFERRADGLAALLRGEVKVGALCGLLYTRHRSQLDVLAAAVPLTPRAQGRAVYFSDVVVRREVGATRLSELRGLRWAINETASFSGYVALLAGLRQSGLTPELLGAPTFSGSHLDSLDLLRADQADVTAIDSGVLELALRQQPDLRRELRVLTSFVPYPAPPLVVHRSVQPVRRARWLAALEALPYSAKGRELLVQAGISHYVPVRPNDYRPISEAERSAAPWLTLSAQLQQSTFDTPISRGSYV